MSESAKVAYFSMEIGLDAEMPTYSGGLGILAGDTIRAAADFRVPMVAMTLLHRKGYFYQRLDPSGWQTEQPAEWVVDDFVKEMPQRACVAIEGRSVHLRAWKFDVDGIGDFQVPVYFLDTDLPENSDWDRRLTDHLYGGDSHYRLCQEVILGIGGVRMLRALGYDQIERFHMNEDTPRCSRSGSSRRKRKRPDAIRSAARTSRRCARNASSPRTRPCRRDTTSFPWIWSRASSARSAGSST